MAEDPRLKLRSATAAERAAIAERAVRYKQLSAKISAYQEGRGPAPTHEEFEQWLEDVERDIALKKALI